MTPPITIQAELRIPQAFMQGDLMEDIERRLHGYGLLPVQAHDLRWRMDPESPGGYVFQYSFTLPGGGAP